MNDQTVLSSEPNPRIHLVVVELHDHSDLIRSMARILRLSRFSLTFITLPELLEQSGVAESIDGERFRACLKEPEESVATFLDRMVPVFKSADILYFSTIRGYWSELARMPIEVPSMVRIPNAHCDLAPLSHFNRPILNFFSILSHLVRKVLIGGEWRMRKRLFNRIDYFMFPNQAITDHVIDHGWVSSQRVLPPVLPFGYLGQQEKRGVGKAGDEVTMAITGKVTNSKKDFHLVFLALRQCLDRLNFPVRLILLGKAGKEAEPILENFRSLESDRFSLDFSDQFVPPDVFKEKVESVDFFVAPIQVETHFRKYREVYGKSKLSGIENDILVWRKPSLVVCDYRLSAPLDEVVDYFDPTPESLAEHLTEWINEGKADTLKTRFCAMQSFEPQAIANRFYELCLGLIQDPQLYEAGPAPQPY